MKTFTGKYVNNNFDYSSGSEAIKMQLLSILNTKIGDRFYYPSYGSCLNQYKFSILNYFTINIISEEVKRVIGLIDGITLNGMSYYVENNILKFKLDLTQNSNNISINLSVADGVAY